MARRRNQTTQLGALLDPIADKLLMSAAFISLVEMDPHHVPAWMVVIIIGREFAVSGLRSIAAQQGVTIAASPLGKGKMVSQVIAISLLILGYELGQFRVIGTVALWGVMFFALASGVDYFIKFARAILHGSADQHPIDVVLPHPEFFRHRLHCVVAAHAAVAQTLELRAQLLGRRLPPPARAGAAKTIVISPCTRSRSLQRGQHLGHACR